MRKGKCTTITPMVYVQNLDAAIDFYTNVLHFEIGVGQEGYAYIVRDEISIRLIATAATESNETSSQSCYICVKDIDSLYEELKSELEKLEKGRVRPPFDQPYGQREFHVTDEDGLLIFFGEAI